MLIPVDNRKAINDERTKNAINAAKAAIIARNLSHNIGSHVLSSVSQYMCDPSDLQYLSKYIQERMDFVAQVITNPPKWTNPAWFVRNILRKLFEQRLLLKYIVKSEGLQGFEYVKDRIEFGQKYFKFYVIILERNSDKHEFCTHYVDLSTFEIEKDIQISIPGGVVGYHAIFTLIENFIRNGSKHSWNKDKNEDEYALYIVIENTISSAECILKIFDNVTNSSGGKTSAEDLNQKLHSPFLEANSGATDSKNWGMKEMKISTGYLNKLNDDYFLNTDIVNRPKDKGFSEDYIYYSEDKHPYINTKAALQKNILPLKNPAISLNIRLRKPKELLIVIHENLCDYNRLKKINEQLTKSGIRLYRHNATKVHFTQNELKRNSYFDFEFCVLYGFDINFDNKVFPYQRNQYS